MNAGTAAKTTKPIKNDKNPYSVFPAINQTNKGDNIDDENKEKLNIHFSSFLQKKLMPTNISPVKNALSKSITKR
jgi:hypothetical protein